MMEHCPLCGADTPVTTFSDRPGAQPRNSTTENPTTEYHCIECHIKWRPGKSYLWSRVYPFSEIDLAYRGISI